MRSNFVDGLHDFLWLHNRCLTITILGEHGMWCLWLFDSSTSCPTSEDLGLSHISWWLYSSTWKCPFVTLIANGYWVLPVPSTTTFCVGYILGIQNKKSENYKNIKLFKINADSNYCCPLCGCGWGGLRGGAYSCGRPTNPPYKRNSFIMIRMRTRMKMILRIMFIYIEGFTMWNPHGLWVFFGKCFTHWLLELQGDNSAADCSWVELHCNKSHCAHPYVFGIFLLSVMSVMASPIVL